MSKTLGGDEIAAPVQQRRYVLAKVNPKKIDEPTTMTQPILGNHHHIHLSGNTAECDIPGGTHPCSTCAMITSNFVWVVIHRQLKLRCRSLIWLTPFPRVHDQFQISGSLTGGYIIIHQIQQFSFICDIDGYARVALNMHCHLQNPSSSQTP
jgi:hypothetical protein